MGQGSNNGEALPPQSISAGTQIVVTARAALLHGERILLRRYTSPADHYNLPGGKARADETIRQTAERKLLEDCGVRATAGRMLFIHESLPLGKGSDPRVWHKFEIVMLASLGKNGHIEEPARPRSGQGASTWVAKALLGKIPLLPPIGREILEAWESHEADLLRFQFDSTGTDRM